MRTKIILCAFSEIILLVCAVFAFSHLVYAVDGESIVNTCMASKTGGICTEYPASMCDEKCTDKCIPSSSDKVSGCELGSCYDKNKGTCQKNSLKTTCEGENVIWFNDVFGNVKECKEGCCILGKETISATSKECDNAAAALGIKKEFREDVTDKITCLALSGGDQEGACVYSGNSCKFITQKECQKIKGDFRTGILCSNPELNTKCVRQSSIKCAPDDEKNIRNEIYWYDSCGNKENIYDANKEKSYNEGKVLGKEQSCSLYSSSNDLANQKTCGNCNVFLGTVCGVKTNSESLAEPNAEVVCKSIDCTDETGKKRANGESWCDYQGSIGVDKGISTDRSSDTPGSGHFRRTCINGEVITEQCGDNRNGICTETKSPLSDGKTFSIAACRINRAYQCYGYNDVEKKSMCEKNPDCFIKKVEVSDKFKFDFCVPKYKPGFELEEQTDGAKQVCSMGTLTCKYVKIKQMFGSKEINKECMTEKFTQQMNDFCMSLGDCGASANYLGKMSENYQVSNAPRLGQTYLNDLIKYADEKLFAGKIASPGNLEDYFKELGIPGDLGTAEVPEDKTASIVKTGGMMAGALGSLLPLAAHTAIGASALSSVGLATPATTVTTVTPFTGTTTTAAGPALSAIGGALAGAAIGFSVVSMLIQFTGVGRGLPPAMTYGLMATGAIAGGIIGYQAMMTGSTSIFGSFGGGGMAAAAAVAWVVLVVVIVFIIVMMIMGVGKVKMIDVKFTCQPWQPTAGAKESDCNKCGSDGLPCTKYSCNSLGQTCKLINEDDPKEISCINIAPDDVLPPVITPLAGSLPETYTYEEFDSGVKIKSNESDGCIKEIYKLIPFGIKLNEPGQCSMGETPLTPFENMETFADNRYKTSHLTPLIIPSLESLGLSPFDPNAKGDVNLYVRCQDKSGNKNGKDYAIRFCIKQGPDFTPPKIVDREPYLESIKFDASAINASVFVDEPAECRWDIADKKYKEMDNAMVCMNEIEDLTARGFPCSAFFQTPKKENTVYIECLDQPWLLGENATKRNEMTESYVFKLNKVANPLKIDSVSPDNMTLSFGIEPATVEVVAMTSGGLDGTATCYFNYNDKLQPFYDTLGSVHKQTFNQLRRGEFIYKIVCEDQIGNKAERTAKVNIKIDAEIPAVTRVYKDDTNLIIVTNENSQCVYGTNSQEKCTFVFSNGTLMDGEKLIHSLQITDATYYIKCADTYSNGNLTDKCGIIVKGERA